MSSKRVDIEHLTIPFISARAHFFETRKISYSIHVDFFKIIKQL